MTSVIQTPICKPNNTPMPARKYWPCAPDGFIPNSIIRHLIIPKKTDMDTVEPWQPKPVNGQLDERIKVPSFYKHEEG